MYLRNRCKRASGSYKWDERAKKRSRLLSEFLQKASAQKLEKETASHDQENEVRNEVTLSDDLLYKIFTLLPAESLFRIQFVCKKWFSLIKNPFFITNHTQQSDTVLICKNLTLLEPAYFAPENKPTSYFHFFDFDHGEHNFIESPVLDLVDIRASCDGLILATVAKNKSLILMNPVTRKHIELPSAEDYIFLDSSFGIAFDNEAKTYKVVHLFRERLGSTRCWILNICTRKWTRVLEGHVPELTRDISKIPVSIGESLNWMSKKHDCDSFVSLNVQNEKFSAKKLPARSRADKGRLLAIGQSLGFVTQPQYDLVQVWILMNGNWMQQYSINLHVDLDYSTPICSSRNGKRMVLASLDNRLHVYDFETCEMRLVPSMYDDEGEEEEERWFKRIVGLYIPHRNTLVSWDINPNET